MRELPITLPSLQVATVKIPAHMSELDFTTLINTVTGWKTALLQPTNEQSGQATDDDNEATDNEC